MKNFSCLGFAGLAGGIGPADHADVGVVAGRGEHDLIVTVERTPVLGLCRLSSNNISRPDPAGPAGSSTRVRSASREFDISPRAHGHAPTARSVGRQGLYLVGERALGGFDLRLKLDDLGCLGSQRRAPDRPSGRLPLRASSAARRTAPESNTASVLAVPLIWRVPAHGRAFWADCSLSCGSRGSRFPHHRRVDPAISVSSFAAGEFSDAILGLDRLFTAPASCLE